VRAPLFKQIMKIAYRGITLEGRDLKELRAILKVIPEFIEGINKALPKPVVRTVSATSESSASDSPLRVDLRDGPNCQEWKRITGKNFRFEKDELATWGKDKREIAAYFRLQREGLDTKALPPGALPEGEGGVVARSEEVEGGSGEVDLTDLALEDDGED
jgi:hypothetical protein